MSMSDSNQEQTTSQQDNRVVIGQGGVNAQTGSNVFVQTLDAQVANHAVDASTKDIKASLDYSRGAVKDAFSFGRGAQSDAFALVKNSEKDAFSFGRGAQSDAFAFATKSQNIALDSLNVEANLVKNAYADAKGRGALTDKILIGSIAMAGLVAIAALRK